MLINRWLDFDTQPEPAWLKTGLVYMASPYSDPDPAVMHERFAAACRNAARFMRLGVKLFSPIAHFHPIAQFGLPKNWAFWQEYDRVILGHCDGMLVLLLPGVEDSKSLAAEIAIAKQMGMPILAVAPEK
jgi:hypothetical protein